MLAAIVLTLHYDAGWSVGQSHSRIGFIDVLTTCAGSAESIDAHIGRIHINLNRSINFGINEYAGE